MIVKEGRTVESVGLVEEACLEAPSIDNGLTVWNAGLLLG